MNIIEMRDDEEFESKIVTDQPTYFERFLACAVINKAVEDYRTLRGGSNYRSACEFLFSKDPDTVMLREWYLSLTELDSNIFAMIKRHKPPPLARFSTSMGMTRRRRERKIVGEVESEVQAVKRLEEEEW